MKHPAPKPLEAASASVVHACNVLDHALRDAMEQGENLDRLVTTLAILDRSFSHPKPGATQILATTLRDLKTHIGAQLKIHEERAFPGAGVITRSMSARSYAWADGVMLAHKVAVRAAEEACVDKETGEITSLPPAVVAGKVAEALIACGGLDLPSNSWRMDSLRSRGIDPSEHRELRNPGSLSCRWVD